MTKNRKSHGGIDRCRNFKNLNISRQRARPVLVKVDPLQADVGAAKWVAPSSLSAPPSAADRRFPAGVRVGDLSFGRRGGKVRRRCHILDRDCENFGKLFPASSLVGTGTRSRSGRPPIVLFDP